MESENHAYYSIPVLAGSKSTTKTKRIGGEHSGIAQKTGFSSEYSSQTGKKVQIGDVNGMFQMASQAGYFNQHGGYHTFSKDVSDKIGGYPEGAILYWLDENQHKLRTVRSMKGDNTDDFTVNSDFIDGVSWKFVDYIPATKMQIAMFADGPVYADNTSSTLEWTAPFDCVVLFDTSTFSRSKSTDSILVKQGEEALFTKVGYASAQLTDGEISAIFFDGQGYQEMPKDSRVPLTGYFGKVVVYMKEGWKLKTETSVLSSFIYYALNFRTDSIEKWKW